MARRVFGMDQPRAALPAKAPSNSKRYSGAWRQWWSFVRDRGASPWDKRSSADWGDSLIDFIPRSSGTGFRAYDYTGLNIRREISASHCRITRFRYWGAALHPSPEEPSGGSGDSSYRARAYWAFSTWLNRYGAANPDIRQRES